MNPAFFEVKSSSHNEAFVIKLIKSEQIEQARKILRGESEEKHVMGTIVKGCVSYNPSWNFHLDPGSISFFENAIEVCDASAGYIEEHLDEVDSDFPPGAHWCPWNSELAYEVHKELPLELVEDEVEEPISSEVRTYSPGRR